MTVRSGPPALSARPRAFGPGALRRRPRPCRSASPTRRALAARSPVSSISRLIPSRRMPASASRAFAARFDPGERNRPRYRPASATHTCEMSSLSTAGRRNAQFFQEGVAAREIANLPTDCGDHTPARDGSFTSPGGWATMPRTCASATTARDTGCSDPNPPRRANGEQVRPRIPLAPAAPR